MCSLPNSISGPNQALWPQSLNSALQRTPPTLFPSLSHRGLAKLDKQLPRAASCLVIVYYGSDWELGTDTSQLSPGCKNLQWVWTKGMVITRQGEMIKWKILDICCVRFVFNKGEKGPGWDITVHSWSLSLSLACQRWGSFSRFDLYPLHNLDRPGTEMRFQSSSKCNDNDADKCSDWNHMWPRAAPQPGMLRAAMQGGDPSVEIRVQIFSALWNGAVGIVAPLYPDSCPVWS